MIIPVLLTYLSTVDGFNLSPVANYVFTQPALKTFIRPTRSSYFGFSVNLRTSGVLVGAPQAQSDLEYQRNINETGAIYKCSFEKPTECVPYRLDRQGNTNYEDYYTNHPEIRSELKEHQMLGATVDGLGSDGAWFVACAPQLKGNTEIAYLLHGVCYLTEGVEATEEPNNLFKIKPLRGKAQQRRYGKSYNYMYGEQGFSLHVTDDGDEVLIGAPGVMDWRGTVLRYHQRAAAIPGNDPASRSNVHQEYNRRRRLTHECVVPNPIHTNVPVNSYFGYAVSSGRFLGNHKVLYVASAPQARSQHGEVIIFDYADNRTVWETVIVRYRTFVGQQFGEYFGYALLTEDFNSDGLPDLAIGAPMHSRAREHDNGVVYVFLNAGELNFELQSKLASSYELGGRFGTSLGKIGDLNRDGYGDIAIGAPFEEAGAVYIFLGSANGVPSRPSQRLVPSAAHLRTPSRHPYMFGHALTRGIDIDGNGYTDLAVGAPNGEAVYVFRSYPIVRIEARINSTKRELPEEGGVFEIAVCWSTEYPAGVAFPVALQYTLDVDGQMGRASVGNRSSPEAPHESVTVSGDPLCRQYSITVNASPTTLYKPIAIEVEFGMAATATPPKGGPFCDRCAILDPDVSSHVQERIPFKTGCRKEVCETDLKITNIRWVDIVPPFVVGSAKKVTLEVEIENAGENAYLPQLNVSVPSFLRSVHPPPSECAQSGAVRGEISILCGLNNGLPLKAFTRMKHSLTLDVTQVQPGTAFLELRLKVLTTSKEQWPRDNEVEERLLLREFSHIDIVSKTTPREANFETLTGFLNVSQLVKLHNNGPSTLSGALFLADIPLSYTPTHLGGHKSCPVVRLEDITVRSSYNETPLEVDWIQAAGGKGLLKQTFAFYSKKQPEPYYPAREEDDVPSNFEFTVVPYNGHEPELLDEKHPYAHALVGNADSARQKRSNLWLAPPTRPSSASIQLDELPTLRTVHFNCAQNLSDVECLQLQIWLPPFPVANKPIYVELQYRLNLNAIAACMREQEDIFVVQVLTDLVKPLDERKETFRIARNHPYTVVYRDVSVSTPIWIYVTSSFGGLLLLAAITYTMHRVGFFERHMRQEMEKMNRESGILDSTTDPEETAQEVSEM
ncbi:integrin alpha-PS3 [Anopheles gambiae]|uniref:integrin alpha-PS3 n=1 Tax=Anopheles gambiae TaxID=7165 RepID=UPI002AC95814|nr:integrin alpha-PS3 [Anopheles gambiae]